MRRAPACCSSPCASVAAIGVSRWALGHGYFNERGGRTTVLDVEEKYGAKGAKLRGIRGVELTQTRWRPKQGRRRSGGEQFHVGLSAAGGEDSWLASSSKVPGSNWMQGSTRASTARKRDAEMRASTTSGHTGTWSRSIRVTGRSSFPASSGGEEPEMGARCAGVCEQLRGVLGCVEEA